MSEPQQKTRRLSLKEVDLEGEEETLFVLRPTSEVEATATLELYQDCAALGGATLLASAALTAQGLSLATTPEDLGLAWGEGELVEAFQPATIQLGEGVSAGEWERNLSADHRLRSRNGRGKWSSVPTAARVDRGGYMFAPAATADDELFPARMWRNARPRQEKLFAIGVRFGAAEEQRLPVLHPNDLAGDDPFRAMSLTLSLSLKLSAGEESREHPLAGPRFEFPGAPFLDDQTEQAAGTLDAHLTREYGNPRANPPLHARDWLTTMQSAHRHAREWRAAVTTAVTFLNANLPADATFEVNEWELATTFLTEGAITSLQWAIRDDYEDLTYSGYSDLGIDSYVTRYRSNSNQIRSYTAPSLRTMIAEGRNIETNTNEAGDTLDTFGSLGVQDACYAVGGLLVEAKYAFAQDLQDAEVVGPWSARVDELPEHVQFFWGTLYYNTGTANGRSTLFNQGLRYHDNIWYNPDDHGRYARFEKFNANWRTATYRLNRAGYPVWNAAAPAPEGAAPAPEGAAPAPEGAAPAPEGAAPPAGGAPAGGEAPPAGGG